MVIQNENMDLRLERAKATFSTNALSCVIWGNTERVKRRHEIIQYVKAHPELHFPKPVMLLTREEKLANISRLTVEVNKHADFIIDKSKPEEIYTLNNLVLGCDGYPFGIHNVMGIPVIINSGDEEQQTEWLPKMLSHQINVVYAQTEIGHGTNLKKLETIAELDRERDEFILNSPTVTSTKYWPGNLGKQATHAVVVAMLQLDGKNYGAHLFIVPLRDLDTHLPLPGIMVGDIGPKFAYDGNDNGFLRLNNVRIPRRFMLSKHVQVTKDGRYICPIHSKVNYTGMMHVRAVMIFSTALQLSQACTIAIRYSCVRHQGELVSGQGEVQVLDYQTQQNRLFPQLSRAFAYLFAGRYIQEFYFRVMENVNAGDVSLMADLHALSSGLKAQVSYLASLGIEQCRMACGGHGFSHASGLPLLYTVVVAGCTYEGENMVMLLQLGRYLLKCAEEVQRSKISKVMKEPSLFTEYFFCETNKKVTKDPKWHQPSTFLCAFEHLSKRLTFQAYNRFIMLQSEKKLVKEHAWNETSIDWTKAARAHTRTFLANNFVQSVANINDLGVRAILTDLLHLFLTYELTECASGLLEDGYLNAADLSAVRNGYLFYLKRIRPQAISIVDSFGFDDLELNSVLGRQDGDVYENLLKWSLQAPLNETQVPEFHKKHLGAAMKQARQSSKI